MVDPNDLTFPVIGLGASAGGLHALEDFFHAMREPPDMAFVIITHLSPDRKSLLTEILARNPILEFEVAQDDQLIQRNKVYVLPPDGVLTVSGGRLRLKKVEASGHVRKPIDIFFSSLAQDRGEYAAGIILSGSGSDGVLGIKAIKEHGGVTFAQTSKTDESGPGFSNMPDSAIATGLVDFAIPVEEMPAKLVEFYNSFQRFVTELPAGDENGQANEIRNTIYSILRTQTGHDLSGYKTTALMRRVHRRMQINQCQTLKDYVERLQKDPDEPAQLFRDLLISVTSFFRDKDAFEALERIVIPRIFEQKGAADWVRIWVPGCATGEEVISIAILAREHMERRRGAPRVTIFATEIDERALEVARAGRYPEALMEGVSQERRERFFQAEPGGYVVAKQVRDLCVFSPHDVLRDPPFSRLNLISCRNLLIYFNAQAQQQVLPVFHYSLMPSGFLFLGRSESIGRFTDLFAPLDKQQCLFEARGVTRSRRLPQSWRTATLAPPAFSGAKSGVLLRQRIESHVADRFAPPHVVVNEEGNIIHFSSRTGKFLESSHGAPTHQLLTMARKELRLDLRGALKEAVDKLQTVRRQLETDDGCLFALTVEPLPDVPGARPLLLVMFDEQAREPRPTDAGEAEASDRDLDLENQLQDTRGRLQTTIEQYETALEELKAANEELVSLNEEMQSSNEELESSKEELQSLNEELQAVNQELNGKVDELDHANGDLRNVFVSTQIATTFLDRALVIRNFTPSATLIFKIISSDVGRPLPDLATNLDYSELESDSKKVLESGQMVERRVYTTGAEPRCFLARLTPYRGSAEQIEGVVATFIDVTNLARSEDYLALHADRLSAMADMATGLAHEINQPLSAAATYLKVIRRLTKMPPEARPSSVDDAVDRATDQIMRAGKIVSHLRTFVGDGKPTKTQESLNALIAEVYEMTVAGAQEKGIELTLELTAHNDAVLMDKLRLKQVLVSLIKNSMETATAPQNHKIRIKTSPAESDTVRVDVADTGAALPDQDKVSLFEPFLTAKEKSLGVGLAISRLIVETHYGKIWVEPNPEGGAVFVFTLPQAHPRLTIGAS